MFEKDWERLFIVGQGDPSTESETLHQEDIFFKVERFSIWAVPNDVNQVKVLIAKILDYSTAPEARNSSL